MFRLFQTLLDLGPMSPLLLLFVNCLLVLCFLHQSSLMQGLFVLGQHFSPFLKVPSTVPGKLFTGVKWIRSHVMLAVRILKWNAGTQWSKSLSCHWCVMGPLGLNLLICPMRNICSKISKVPLTSDILWYFILVLSGLYSLKITYWVLVGPWNNKLRGRLVKT